MQSESMHGPSAKKNHSCDTDSVVQCTSCTSQCEQNQGCLSGNGIIIVSLCDENVEPDEGQQEDSKGKVGSKRGRIQPTPVVNIQCKTIEDFHRYDDPCDPKEMHCWIWNPFLACPQTGQTHDDEKWPADHWRECSSDDPAKNRPHQDHPGEKTVAESTLSMNCNVGDTIRRGCFSDGSITFDGSRFIGLLIFTLENGGDFSDGLVLFRGWSRDVVLGLFLIVSNHELAEVNSATSSEFLLSKDIIFHIIVVRAPLLHTNVLAKSRLKPSPFGEESSGFYQGRRERDKEGPR